MMKAPSYAALVVFVAIAVLVLGEGRVSMAATCDATQLTPCLGAITSNSPPSALCCSRLRSQRPCLCSYLRNPFLGRYVNSPNARKVANTCKCSRFNALVALLRFVKALHLDNRIASAPDLA
ncbi:hypothetical protein Sjap_024953 [Stephania japonica]|uniref:Bifunctional inhibitor/plant lipid transfer protein/seed storage helical domain-containing protein n=1 Tax=Stephania japonica TaxID=461633 RepID=A0AAP0EEA1_9MAGN